jgi:pimeloyl-ACP methyl ester carboxylesterase
MEAAMNYGRRVPAVLRELRLPLAAINPGEPSTDVSSLRRHGVDVALISDVGHFPMMEAPREFNRRLIEILERFKSIHDGDGN